MDERQFGRHCRGQFGPGKLRDRNCLEIVVRQRKIVATAGRSYGGPSEKFVGGFGGNFQKLPPSFSEVAFMWKVPRNAFWGNFLEVCFRTPGTSQKLLQRSALRCILLLSVLSGETIFAARHQDVSQGPLGEQPTDTPTVTPPAPARSLILCTSSARRVLLFLPPKNGPKSQLKCPKSPFLGIKMSKNGPSDILIDFWVIFSGGPKRHFSDFKMHFCGFGVPGLCRRLQDNASQKATRQFPEIIAARLSS